jgi:hypothetical protein
MFVLKFKTAAISLKEKVVKMSVLLSLSPTGRSVERERDRKTGGLLRNNLYALIDNKTSQFGRVRRKRENEIKNRGSSWNCFAIRQIFQYKWK